MSIPGLDIPAVFYLFLLKSRDKLENIPISLLYIN